MSVSPCSNLTSKLDAPLSSSGNGALGDVIKWIKDDNYLVINAMLKDKRIGVFFHTNCTGSGLNQDEMNVFLQNHKVVSMDVSCTPHLLDIGEWPSYIEEEGIKQCTCSLQGRVSTLDKEIPHLLFMQLQDK